MRCPNCGTNLPDSARFCTSCGARLEPTRTAPHVPGSPHTEQGRTQAGKNKRPYVIVGIVVAATVLLVSLVVTITTCSLVGSLSASASHTPHPVTFIVNVSGLDEHSSRIPVRITGTDMDGNDVDKTIFLAYSGVDVELLKGTYHAEVVGAPISSSGIVYDIPTKAIDFTLGNDLKEGEAYQLYEAVLTFTPINPASLTDEQVANAIAWARKDEQSGADVGELEKAIAAKRDAARGDGQSE